MLSIRVLFLFFTLLFTPIVQSMSVMDAYETNSIELTSNKDSKESCHNETDSKDDSVTNNCDCQDCQCGCTLNNALNDYSPHKNPLNYIKILKISFISIIPHREEAPPIRPPIS